MISRIWRTKIDPARLEAYQRFERERGLPILHKQPGLLGVEELPVLLVGDLSHCDALGHAPLCAKCRSEW